MSASAGFVQSGSGICRARVGFFDVDGGPAGAGSIAYLSEFFAAPAVPGITNFVLNEPVKLNPGDQVILTGSVIGDGECRLESDFGYRVQVQEE